ncbi:hypothetical protein Acsp04_51260 [Actinomadura sp. NBRC 104425]|nr:hypothetical protein Acsp04_51260 [Actinomadura sp. NBRC 104425]
MQKAQGGVDPQRHDARDVADPAADEAHAASAQPPRYDDLLLCGLPVLLCHEVEPGRAGWRGAVRTLSGLPVLPGGRPGSGQRAARERTGPWARLHVDANAASALPPNRRSLS